MVFFAADGLLVQKALQCVRTLATDWVEARPYAYPLTDCDLLITLDAQGLRDLPPLPQGVRHKHWPLSSAALDRDLEARMKGLVGGMRLLASLDRSAAPPRSGP